MISKQNLIRCVVSVSIALLMVTISITVVVVSKINPRQTSIVTPVKKILFVIADGIPADLIENVTILNIRKIQNIGKYKRAYVGGHRGTYTQTPTISAPGYFSLLTGTWANKHNVYDNGANQINYHYKHIFRLVKEQHPNKKIGIFSSWTDNRVKFIGEGLSKAGNIIFDYKFDGYDLDEINYPHDPKKFYRHYIDQRVANETAKCVRNNAPDVSWVYLQYTDDIGHMYGDSAEMNQAVSYLDRQIGLIYDAIEYRINHHHEDWLIVITTDHGRDPVTGKKHGKQSKRERTTWIVMNKNETNQYFDDYQPSIVDLMPTMIRFLDVNIPYESERELDGIPLIGQVSLAKPSVILHENTLRITWKALDNRGNVRVWLSTTNLFRSGIMDEYILIGTVPVRNETGTFDIRDYSSQFYKIVLEGQYNMVNKWIIKS